MSQREKLIASVRNNPKDVRFEDACKIAEWYGFTLRGGGKHSAVYIRKGMALPLNFQKRKDGKAKRYQVIQLIEAMDIIDSISAPAVGR